MKQVMTNLDSILKSRGITLPTKVHLVKAMVFPVVMYGCESWTIKRAEHRRIDAFELLCWRRVLRVPWTARRSNQSILKEISPVMHWKDWCWCWNSNTLATWCEELTCLKKPSCWERLKVGREGDDRGWDGWMASLTWWTWVWVNSGSWWWTRRPGVLPSVGLQRVRHNWATELNWWMKKFAGDSCVQSLVSSWELAEFPEMHSDLLLWAVTITSTQQGVQLFSPSKKWAGNCGGQDSGVHSGGN